MITSTHSTTSTDTSSGDRLLQECAAAWGRQLRPDDLLARYGGEEFAILLRGCSLEGATTVLDRVRKATPGGVTCSIGLAERTHADTAHDLVARADAALYQAKREGRDRLVAAWRRSSCTYPADDLGEK